MKPLREVRRRLARNRLRRRVPLTRHVALRNRLLRNRPDRLAGDPIEHVQHPHLRRLGDRLDRLAVDDDVHQQRRRGHVVVPDVVVHDLVVPLHLAGLQVDRDKAVRIQVVARPFAAVEVTGRRFHGQIGEVRVGIGRDAGPDAGVAGRVGRPVQPGVVALLALLRDRVPFPDLAARPDVEGLHQPLVVLVAGRREPFAERRPDQHLVAGHGGGGVQADFAGRQVGLDPLAVALLHVDPAVDAERLDALSGLGVERHQEVPGRDVEDPRADAVPARPVGQAAARQLTRRGHAARPFVLAVHPEQFARGGVERDHVAAVAARGVEHAVHFDRRPFQLVLGMISQIVRLETPGHFHVAEVRGVDLVQRQVPAPRQVAEIRRPVHVPAGAGLRERHGREQQGGRNAHSQNELDPARPHPEFSSRSANSRSPNTNSPARRTRRRGSRPDGTQLRSLSFPNATLIAAFCSSVGSTNGGRAYVCGPPISRLSAYFIGP